MSFSSTVQSNSVVLRNQTLSRRAVDYFAHAPFAGNGPRGLRVRIHISSYRHQTSCCLLLDWHFFEFPHGGFTPWNLTDHRFSFQKEKEDMVIGCISLYVLTLHSYDFSFVAQMESNSAETQSSSAQVSQTTETQTTLILNPGNATQQDLQAFLSLPHRYQRRQLTEAEIEAINVRQGVRFLVN